MARLTLHSPIGIAIHAGAGSLPRQTKRLRSHRKIVREIIEESYAYLKHHSALETVVHAVTLMEDYPGFNAGTGSKLQRDGKARMSASVMDGKTLSFAGVVNIERIRNPIAVAKLLLLQKDRILAGEGARRFALESGFKDYDPVSSKSLKEWKAREERLPEGSSEEDFFETVGACALGGDRHLASATSTGGRGYERAGRVSDSATPCGNYANSWAAVSATGIGEDIVDEVLACRLALSASTKRSLQEAFREVFHECRMTQRTRKRLLGAIGIDRFGHFSWCTTTDVLLYGFKNNSRLSIFPLRHSE
jgi:L-asparaginase